MCGGQTSTWTLREPASLVGPECLIRTTLVGPPSIAGNIESALGENPYRLCGSIFETYVLIVVDAYSKWTEVCVMRTSTTTATVEKMRGIFATLGLPVLVVSDNGPARSSKCS